jgi:hypothetical protein
VNISSRENKSSGCSIFNATLEYKNTRKSFKGIVPNVKVKECLLIGLRTSLQKINVPCALIITTGIDILNSNSIIMEEIMRIAKDKRCILTLKTAPQTKKLGIVEAILPNLFD